MGDIYRTILLAECRSCRHYEREKLHQEGHEGKLVVMCKYYLEEGKEPFEIVWIEASGTEEHSVIRCPMVTL